MKWIDSHCHLNHINIKDAGTVDDIVSRAKKAGVEAMLTVNCRISDEFTNILSIANKFDNIWCSVGTHPHDAACEEEMKYSTEDIVKLAKSSKKIIAIGETGLDYFYNNSPKEEQQKSFRKHIKAAIQTNLPLIVHSRDADDDTIKILSEEGKGTKLKGVMHCFSSTEKLAKASLDLGFYISFSGIVTFNKASELREIAKTVPLDRILTETDAPFLAPTPHRGKTCEPSLMVHTGEVLANIHELPLSKFAEISYNNFFKLFDKAKFSE